MILSLLAHAGEDHTDTADTTRHLFEADPLMATIVALSIIILIPFSIHQIWPKSGAAIIVLLIELFFVGILLYSTLPILSIICLASGFIIAFAFAFGGIIHGG